MPVTRRSGPGMPAAAAAWAWIMGSASPMLLCTITLTHHIPGSRRCRTVRLVPSSTMSWRRRRCSTVPSAAAARSRMASRWSRQDWWLGAAGRASGSTPVVGAANIHCVNLTERCCPNQHRSFPAHLPPLPRWGRRKYRDGFRPLVGAAGAGFRNPAQNRSTASTRSCVFLGSSGVSSGRRRRFTSSPAGAAAPWSPAGRPYAPGRHGGRRSAPAWRGCPPLGRPVARTSPQSPGPPRRIKAAEAGPPGRAETRDYRAQDPFNPQFCAEACFMCKAAVMKVPRSIGCPSPRAVVPRMLRAPVLFHHNGRAKGSGRPIILPTISRRWYCPPSKQASWHRRTALS